MGKGCTKLTSSATVHFILSMSIKHAGLLQFSYQAHTAGSLLHCDLSIFIRDKYIMVFLFAPMPAVSTVLLSRGPLGEECVSVSFILVSLSSFFILNGKDLVFNHLPRYILRRIKKVILARKELGKGNFLSLMTSNNFFLVPLAAPIQPQLKWLLWKYIYFFSLDFYLSMYNEFL